MRAAGTELPLPYPLPARGRGIATLRLKSGALVPHLAELGHVLDQKILVLVPPGGDGAVLDDRGLAVADHHDRLVADQRVVDAEELRAPPFYIAKDVLAGAALLHGGEHGFRLGA